MGVTKTVNKKEHKFPYRWNLSDGYPAPGIEYHGCKVFGTFVCGGGSTMGYKLAGFDHLGGVEIDPKVAEVYRINHNPRHFYIQDIREFNKREDLPPELYDLDLLDGSPPCSSFSMAGNREKDWGKKKQFREGQEYQRLDDLVFEYVRTIEKLQPRVALLENVKGLIAGNAKAYAKKLKQAFEAAGYRVQAFLLNAASMGVPQKRERVFFIGLRKDFDLPGLILRFDEAPIAARLAIVSLNNSDIEMATADQEKWWSLCKQGDSFSSVHPKGSWFNSQKLHPEQPSPTVAASGGAGGIYHYSEPRKLSDIEHLAVQTFPIDYFLNGLKGQYLCGMSVPPIMTAQIAHQVWLQWLSRIAPKTG